MQYCGLQWWMWRWHGFRLLTRLWHVGQANIPREQVHAIRENLPVAEAATEYAGQLLRLDKTVLPRNAEGERLLDSCTWQHSVA